MSSVRLKIGDEVARSIVEQINDAGLSFARDENGNPRLFVKFPGLDVIGFSREDLTDIINRLEAPKIEGSNPGAVFQRSATEDEEGNLISKFSDEKRARTITFKVDDRAEVADLLDAHLAKWDDYEKDLSKAEEEQAEKEREEAKAARSNAKDGGDKGGDGEPKRKRGRPRKDDSRVTA